MNCNKTKNWLLDDDRLDKNVFSKRHFLELIFRLFAIRKYLNRCIGPDCLDSSTKIDNYIDDAQRNNFNSHC